ncbi:MAG: PTS sugar transporter subunit IIB [Coprobacillus sp.]
MIKILLCCGGGFSSSAISQRMKKEIIETDMEKDVSIDFQPFSLGVKRIEQYDIMVCCPHLNIYVKQLVQKQTLEVPIYILPPKMYGMMEIKEIYQDALDIIKIFKETKVNPVSFPGEENVLRIQRQCAYAHKK